MERVHQLVNESQCLAFQKGFELHYGSTRVPDAIHKVLNSVEHGRSTAYHKYEMSLEDCHHDHH